MADYSAFFVELPDGTFINLLQVSYIEHPGTGGGGLFVNGIDEPYFKEPTVLEAIKELIRSLPPSGSIGYRRLVPASFPAT